MNRLEHTGDSANIAFYGEKDRGQRKTGYIWCEVLRTDHLGSGKGLLPLRVPFFWITIHRHGTGKIGQRKYVPRKAPAPGPLPGNIVTRLVRETLDNKARTVQALLTRKS